MQQEFLQNYLHIINLELSFFGEVAEWFKAHAWKVCVLLKVPRVRIPVSPPTSKKPLK